MCSAKEVAVVEAASTGHGSFSGAPTVASFCTFADATRAVDYLADRGVAARHIAVVVRDFRLGTCSDRRVAYAVAAAGGALSGATIGALVVLVLGVAGVLVLPGSLALTALAGGMIGGMGGASIAVIGHRGGQDAARRRSVRALDAARYDVVVAASAAERARRVLRELTRDPAA
jgi:hypothetical protein